MEKETPQKKKDEVEEALRDLQRDLNHDLIQGHYYGLDQKIRNIQKALALSLRV